MLTEVGVFVDDVPEGRKGVVDVGGADEGQRDAAFFNGRADRHAVSPALTPAADFTKLFLP